MSNCNDRCADITTLTSQPLLSDNNDRNCDLGIHVLNNTTRDDRLTSEIFDIGIKQVVHLLNKCRATLCAQEHILKLLTSIN